MDRVTADRGELFRLLDPWGAGVGFMAPLFRCPDVNPPCLQVQRAGSVAGFAPLERDSYDGVAVDERWIKAGEAVVWAFAFGDGDILIGQDDRDLEALAARLDDTLFETRPMLAVEVAEFVGRRADRAVFARRAFDRIRSASPSGAAAWRDLSILTPDVIASLRALQPDLVEQAAPDLRRVVVSVENGGLLVRGVDAHKHPLVLGPIVDAIGEALAALGPLYSDVGKNPPMSFARHKEGVAAPPLEDPQGRFLLFHPALEPLESLLRRRLAESYFFKDVSGPYETLSVAPFDAGPEDMPLGDVHFVLRPGGELSDRDRERIGRLPPSTVIVDAPHGMDRRFGDNPAVTLLYYAIHAVTGMRATRQVQTRLTPSFYFQTAGVGPHPALDGWCQLYGRIAKLDLTGASGFRFQPTATRRDEQFEGEAEAMFPDMQRLDLPPAGRTRRRGVSGALVRYEPDVAEQEAARLHRRVVERVLIRTGWEIPDPGDPRGPGRTLFVRGEAGGFDCDTVAQRPLAPTPPTWLPHWRAEPLRAKRVVAVEGFTGAETARHLLVHNELVVSVRDLALSRPDFPPVVGLLAGQIRRFVSNLTSKERTPYLAMITHMALTEGRVEFGRADWLRGLLESEDLGRAFQLICRSVDHSMGVTARFRVLERRAPRDIPPVMDFAVEFDRGGLTLREDEP